MVASVSTANIDLRRVITERAPVAPDCAKPATIAGLRRIATLLWLHFVALPQRVPVGYRRWVRPVVDVIDKVPFSSLNPRRAWLTSTSIQLRSSPPTNQIRHQCRVDVEHRAANHVSTFSKLRLTGKYFNTPKVR